MLGRTVGFEFSSYKVIVCAAKGISQRIHYFKILGVWVSSLFLFTFSWNRYRVGERMRRAKTALLNIPYVFINSVMLVAISLSVQAADIVHDAEYYIIEAQNGERWTAEDKELDARLAELKKEHGKAPNIVYILWDDMAVGDAGMCDVTQ